MVPVQKAHIIFDLYKADADILGKADALKASLLEALKDFNLDIQINSFYQFEPEGVTAIVTSPDLHFNIHTWPENQSCAIDLYSLKGQKFGLEVCNKIKQHLKADEYQMKVLDRKKSQKESLETK